MAALLARSECRDGVWFVVTYDVTDPDGWVEVDSVRTSIPCDVPHNIISVMREEVVEPLEPILPVVRSSGASELVDGDDGPELRIYGSFEDAVSQGIEKELAAKVFAMVKPGNCVRQDNPKGTRVRCRSTNCTGSCHVFSLWKDDDGDIHEFDETHAGNEDSDGWVPRAPGRFYVCRCV